MQVGLLYALRIKKCSPIAPLPVHTSCLNLEPVLAGEAYRLHDIFGAGALDVRQGPAQMEHWAAVALQEVVPTVIVWAELALLLLKLVLLLLLFLLPRWRRLRQ